MFDEFYQELNAIFYLKWITYQGRKYNLNSRFDINDGNCVLIENDKVEGKVIYYGDSIFEEILVDRDTKEKIFYLHFQLKHLNHATMLFNEMARCAMNTINQRQRTVLLCCSGGLTTTLFANTLTELAKLKNLPYKIGAIGYAKLYDVANDYELILLAPQVGYLLPEIKNKLKDKQVLMIPIQIFATSNFSDALKLIENSLK